ncbi:hypothetical protein HanIR_Chr05g0221631 [Helianthus annuus]|nr:hypothetical protein HanIR_Chr05g0221631 [Helianthus annuus]
MCLFETFTFKPSVFFVSCRFDSWRLKLKRVSLFTRLGSYLERISFSLSEARIQSSCL